MDSKHKKHGMFTILLVDDDHDNLQLLSLCLQDTGHRILVALDGQSGIERAMLAKPDLILMDVVMPKMDGFETCKRMKEIHELQDTPIIFMTSLSDTTNKIKGFDVGGVDYIAKPVRFEEVLARVNVHLKIIEQRKELQLQREEIEQWAEEQAAMNQELGAMNEELLALNQELTATNEVVFQENNERKKVEKQLSDANIALKNTINDLKEMQNFVLQTEKMSALGNLVAGLAHEINTPIGVGITASSNLKDLAHELKKSVKNENLSTSEVFEYIEDIYESADIIFKNLDRAGQLIRNFKLVSTDQSEMIKRMIPIKNYMDEILLTLRPKLATGNYQVIIDCDEHLEVLIYAGALVQIFTNLIMNSITHAFSGSKEGIIRITIRLFEDKLKIVFEDNGQGMSYEVLSQIYEPFFTTKRAHGGTGLGMYIVYNIVTQQFNGTMDCKSEENIGTRFDIILKL